MKVLFLVAYSQLAAASRIKVYQFLPLLESRGIQCKTVCFTPSFVYRIRLASATKKYLLVAYYPLCYIIRLYKTVWAIMIASKFDIVFVQEPIIPFGFPKVLTWMNKNIIFLFTDAVFLGKQSGAGFLEGMRTQALYAQWKGMAKIATYCLVENDYNKKAVLEFCPRVEKVAGPMDMEKYLLRGEGKAKDKIVIGWAGSPFTTKYLHEIKPALKELSGKYDVVIRLMGIGKDFNLEGIACELIPWKLETELSWIATFDIGIMPLTDDSWTRGKGGYKLLQYMSMGIPSIASPVGINKEIIQDGVNGFLARDRREWVEKTSLLIENGDLRKKMGLNARKTIEERYSLQAALEKLIKIFTIVSSQ